MKKCPKCNAEFAWGTQVCPSCGKKVKNPKVELHLKNPAGQECKISCSENIKMNFGQTCFELRFGVPALNVKPVNGADVAITFALFLLIFLLPAALQNGFGVVLCLGMLVVNVVYTMNFYVNTVKKKLATGYVPADDDTAAILQNAGIFVSQTQFQNTANFGSVTNTANASGMVSCPACGAQNEGGAKFCAKCGKPMSLPAADPMEQIEKLGALMEKGLLSKEEFEAQKAKLLGL